MFKILFTLTIFIIGILFVCLIFAFLIFIDQLMEWCLTRCGKLNIKLKQFKLFYSMNPDAWKLEDDYAVYKVFNRQGYVTKTYLYCFPFIDYIKYKILRKKLLNKKEQAKYTELYLEALEYIKKDIEKFTEQNNDFVKEQLEKLQNTERYM